MTAQPATDDFEAHRPLLMGVAYRMLGRVADAEDVVQEAWLRWYHADREKIREPRAYLVRVTTRLAIDRLRQVQRRAEAYVGPWLPEPYLTEFAGTAPDSADRAVLADTVSLAVLVVLESLSPLERAVFVLREAFGYPYAEIATLLERTEPAVRQLAGRARRHVAERRPRHDVEPARRRELTERFLDAAGGGDLAGLMSLLAPDVRLVGDSGGKAKAPVRVLHTADKVGRFLVGAARTAPADRTHRFLETNGGPALLILTGGEPDSLFQVDIADGRITSVYVIRNPDKLRHLTAH
ncbi:MULTISPECIES: RNA polymerase sigma-70 factor [Streptomyces]|uniref:RNA polymerase sigma-70 factor n=1 Tax=Streptomyces TaxID=1883 RepID=UPI001673634E|nr:MULTISPECIES: RNA polymerase sigma-70 factor [Streptomyces]MBK3523629.1 RNA polymerase sigma-70 factor [Streptomyces sp. MBT70]GGR83209.1 RNA polymerase sigma24 factor [Streptomyces eurythermus]